MKKIAHVGLSLSVVCAACWVVGSSQSFADLVYDEQVQPGSEASIEGTRTEDRSSMRTALGSAEKARVAINNRPTIGVLNTQSVIVGEDRSAPATVSPTAPGGVNLSKSELLRRERMRTELQNEDVLQERLEELRLRDEKRRTDEVLGRAGEGDAEFASEAHKNSVKTGHQSNVTDVMVSSQAAPQPMAPTVSQPVVQVVPQVMAAPQVVDSMPTLAPVMTSNGTYFIPAEKSKESTQVSVMPRGGLSSMTGSSGYNILSRYSVGLGLGVNVSENLAFELGYTYSEYGVALSSSNPFVLNYQYYLGNAEPLVMKQNLVDAGLRLYFLGTESKIRPFIGGGAAYGKSYINYDQKIMQGLSNSGYSYMANDYEVSSFLGFLSAGFDLKLAKSISVGAMFRYYGVLTTRENSSLNNAAFSPYSYYGSGYYNYSADSDKQILGGSLARNPFYSILAGVSFTF